MFTFTRKKRKEKKKKRNRKEKKLRKLRKGKQRKNNTQNRKEYYKTIPADSNYMINFKKAERTAVQIPLSSHKERQMCCPTRFLLHERQIYFFLVPCKVYNRMLSD